MDTLVFNEKFLEVNGVLKGGEHPIDLQIYDIKNCFDSLWEMDVVNNMYEFGMKNMNLNLIHNENQTSNITVKMPHGESKEFEVKNSILQGTKLGPSQCIVNLNEIGSSAFQHPSTLYNYRGIVATPPLQAIDDIIAIQYCGGNRLSNKLINAVVNEKKLDFSETKCALLPIGNLACK